MAAGIVEVQVLIVGTRKYYKPNCVKYSDGLDHHIMTVGTIPFPFS